MFCTMFHQRAHWMDPYQRQRCCHPFCHRPPTNGNQSQSNYTQTGGEGLQTFHNSFGCAKVVCSYMEQSIDSNLVTIHIL